MSSKFKLILKGSSFRVIQTIVSIVIGLLMMPFLISTLGNDQYGLWIVIGSIVGTYYLLDLGFNQAVTRYVSQFIHQNDPAAANRIINTAIVVYSLLGVVVLIASIIAAFYGAESLMKNSENLTLAQIILIVSGLSLAFEFPSKAFTGIISAYMRYDFISIVRFSKSILDAILIYVFLSNGYGLVAMSIIMFVTGLIGTSIYVWFTTSIFKELQFSWRLIELPVLREIFSFSKWVFFLDMNNMIRSKMDIWFISFYLSTGVLTVYYVAVRLIDYAIQLLTQATGITGPIFTEYYAKSENKKLITSFKFFFKINMLLASVVVIGFYLVSESFIGIWMGDDFDIKSAYVCLLILSFGRLVTYMNNPVTSLLMTLKKHKICAYLSVVEMAVSALLCWILIPQYGLIGAGIAISAPYVIQAVILPLYAAQNIQMKMYPVVIRVLVYYAISALIWYVLGKELIGGAKLGITAIVLAAFAVLFVQVCISFLIWDREERVMVSRYIKQKLGYQLS